jgi:glucokinase
MSKWCVGIDLGGTYIKFVLVDEGQNPSESIQLPTPLDRGHVGVVEQMVAGARQLMEAHGLSDEDVAGVGIGSPGPINITEGLVMATPNLPGLNNCPLRDLVSEALGFPAVLENDANAAAYGEYIAGAGKGTGDMVMLTLGTGVGGGVVIDGKILHGSHDAGAELGHIILVPGGELCGCGQRGCLEQYASATFLAKRTTRRIEEEGVGSSLKTVLDEKSEIDARDINEARKAGDKLAAEMWDEAIRYLAQGCVDLCRIFDPDRIVLSGGMTKAGDDLMEPLQKHFRELDWKLMPTPTEIAIASLGNDAGSIGAAGVAWQAFGQR